MTERIKKYIEEYNMIKPKDHVLAGVSGGADSVCLCLVLSELAEEMDFTLEVIHVEHGIRGEESARDARFVREFCSQLGVKFYEVAVDVPEYASKMRLGLEEAARMLRYNAFSDISHKLKENEKAAVSVALAHHMEDNAETILMQMIRGSGLDGICGMEPVRSTEAGERYLRPLLAESRESIEEYLRLKGQPFCEDSTNSDLAYSRNRIRKKVLPELTALNSQAILHINRTAERMRDIRDYMDAETDALLEKCLKKGENGYSLSVGELNRMQHAVRMRVLHDAISAAAGARKDIAAVHIEAVEQLLYKQSGRSVDLPYGITARRVYEEIEIKAGAGENFRSAAKEETVVDIGQLSEEKPLIIELPGAGLTCRLFRFIGKTAKIPRKMYTKWFDYDKIKDNFSIRTRKSGDFFILDDKGHRKKLADYFIDEKIPADQRDKYLLVAKGSEVLWIIGGRMSHDAGITKDTRLVLEMTWAEPAQPFT
jgi:tRNA(Ile)-lysidine synthase